MAGKSIKVKTLNTNHVIVGMIEQALLQHGWEVVSDNYLSGSYPNGMVQMIETGDTTFSTPQHSFRSIRLFEDQSADYILKYQYSTRFSMSKLVFNQFNASLVNTQTGKIVASFTHRQSNGIGKKPATRVINEMCKALRKSDTIYTYN